MMIPRRHTRQIQVGKVAVGGGDAQLAGVSRGTGTKANTTPRRRDDVANHRLQPTWTGRGDTASAYGGCGGRAPSTRLKMIVSLSEEKCGSYINHLFVNFN